MTDSAVQPVRFVRGADVICGADAESPGAAVIREYSGLEILSRARSLVAAQELGVTDRKVVLLLLPHAARSANAETAN